MNNIQITIRDMPHSIALENHIQAKIEKLDLFYHRFMNCRVVIALVQKHKHQGKLFSARIDLTVPGKKLVVNRKVNEDIYVAIRDAFQAMSRQLENYARKQRGHVKHHDHTNKGIVRLMVPDEGYGFIHGTDGNDYYFGLNNVTHPDFDHLDLDDTVEFIGVVSQEGYQANRVTKTGHINIHDF